jgi:hypothetical protein
MRLRERNQDQEVVVSDIHCDDLYECIIHLDQSFEQVKDSSNLNVIVACAVILQMGERVT